MTVRINMIKLAMIEITYSKWEYLFKIQDHSAGTAATQILSQSLARDILWVARTEYLAAVIL